MANRKPTHTRTPQKIGYTIPMGRKRKTGKKLPQRVYLRSNTYWYAHPDGQWIKLGRSEREMYNSMAELGGDRPGALKHYFQRYRKDNQHGLAAKETSTQKDQARQLQRLIKVFGKMLPSEVTPQHIARFLREYPAPVQANRHIALLSDVYSTMISWWLVPGVTRNPCIGVKRNPERPRTRYVTDAEFWAVWKLALPQLQILMELAYLTGLRQGQILTLKYSHFDKTGLHIKAGKGGKKLILEWTPALTDVVERSRGGVAAINGWLIRKKNGQAYTQDGIQSNWQRLIRSCHEAGVIAERFTFQDIRAKSATDHESGKHLGHQSAKTLEKFYRRKPTIVRGL